MAIVGQLVVLMGVNNAPLTAGLAASQAQLTAFSATSATTSAAVARNFALIRTAALGVGAVALVGMGLGVSAARDFQEQLATINTIAKQTPEALAGIGASIRRLSEESGTALPDLTAGFYDLLSAGVPLANAMELLANSVTLSIGGLSTTNEAVNAITTALNAWGVAGGEANLTMEDSALVMDVFAQAIETGVLKASDIAGAISQIAPLASAMNIPLQEVAATWAVMTTRGFSAAEAATSMNSALVALQRIPPGMQLLQEATGKSYEAIARTEGAQAAMQALVTDAQQYGVALIDVFGRQEALAFAINTTGAAAPAYQAALTNMYNSTGAASAQAAERMGTLDRQLAILGASLNSLGISIGTALLPPLTSFVQEVTRVVQGVTAWATANPGLAGSILPVVAGVALLLAGILAVNVAIGVLALLLSPVGIALAIIGGIIVLVTSNFDNLQRGVQVVIDTIQRLIDLAARGADAVSKIPGVELVGDVARNVSNPPGGVRRNPLIEGIRNGSGSMPGVSGYAHGGMVPGIGPQLAIVHGGETVSPAGRAAFGGGADGSVTTNLTHTTVIQLDGRVVAEVVEQLQAVREGLVTVLRPGTA